MIGFEQRSSGKEATTLPTEPQPLSRGTILYEVSCCVRTHMVICRYVRMYQQFVINYSYIRFSKMILTLFPGLRKKQKEENFLTQKLSTKYFRGEMVEEIY